MHFSNQPVLTDFNQFLDYLNAKQPLPLTNEKMVLKGPTSVALNELMTSFQTPFVTVKNHLMAFNLISTFFYIAQKASFFTIKLNVKNTKPQLVIDEDRVRLYDAMTDDEKYFFLLETFWCYVDWETAYEGRSFWDKDFYLELAKYPVGKTVSISDINLNRSGVLQSPSFLFAAEIFSAFGFLDLVWDDKLEKRPQKYSFPYKTASITAIGKKILPILIKKRPLYQWQLSENKLYESEFYEEDEDDIEEEKERKELGVRTKDEKFEDAFLPHFKDLKIETHLLSFKIPYIAGEYILKVALEDKIYRVISIGADHTYEDLHLAIQDAFGFYDDHLYAFFMDNKKSRNSLSFWSPDAEDGIEADAVPIGKSTLSVGKSFLYLYDFGSEWHFQITVQAIHLDSEEPKEPTIIESVGDAPEEYDDYDEEEDDDLW